MQLNMNIENNESRFKQVINDFGKLYNQEIIYKYTGFNTALEHIITNNTLQFSNPKDFNDPFDCHEGLINVAKFSDDDFLKIMDDSEIVTNHMNSNSLPIDFYEKNREELLKRIRDKKEIQGLWKKKHSHYRVTCFSAIPDNPLMWAHYAEKHSGISLGFKFPLFPDSFRVYPVNYYDVINPIEARTAVTKVIHYWLTSKSHHWAYENEFRAVTMNDTEIIKFPQEWLTEIIFGCRVSEKNIEKIVRLVRNKLKYKTIKIKKVKINPETFSLKLITLYDIQNHKNKLK